MSLANDELKHAEYLQRLWKILSAGGEVKIEDILACLLYTSRCV